LALTKDKGKEAYPEHPMNTFTREIFCNQTQQHGLVLALARPQAAVKESITAWFHSSKPHQEQMH
jgi:hypothetical protein